MASCLVCGKALQIGARFCSWCGAVQDHRTGLLPPHATLHHGRYLILATVGRGGMGAVYRAQDTQLKGRLVAIKEMGQDGLTGQELQDAVAAFEREAEMLAHLHHVSLPHIYEQFEDRGRRYLVMEFIEGETLEQRLQREGRSLPLTLALEITRQLCLVLHYLHSQQPPIIFRDLKPSNIMLDAEQRVYLIDFGIARLFTAGQVKDTVALGSPGYAPPEQYRKATSPRSDIYSLGATLHALLSGDDPAQSPFSFRPLTLGSPPLERLIRRMVALEEDERPADMLEILRVIERVQQRRPTRKATKPPKKTTPRLSVLLSEAPEDQRLWRGIQQQLHALLVGFPPIEIERFREDGREPQLALVLLSDTLLASGREHLERALTMKHVLVVPLQAQLPVFPQVETLFEGEGVAHQSLYAQEQHILEVAKRIRSLLVSLLLGERRNGQMNLLEWLLYQLYGRGYRDCRYLTLHDVVLKHVRPAGASRALVHLLERTTERVRGEYLIGPLQCTDLERLLEVLAVPNAQAVSGIATRQIPHKLSLHR